VIRRRDAVVGLALAATACTPNRAPASNSTRGDAAAQGRGDLPRFFASLAALAAGRRPSPVTVLQIGDSHTANDGFSGRMRELMQARFGDAGRGLLPPAIPFRYYRPDGVHVTASGWQLISSFDARAAGPFGITGLRQHSAGRAAMTVEVQRPGDLGLTTLEFLAQPGGGHADIAFDAGPAELVNTDVTTQAGAPIVWSPLAAPDALRMIVTTRGDGLVDMLSCQVGRRNPGVTWSNLGTIGATVELLSRWDNDIVRAELQRLQPDLIVLAFGTNEGFQRATDLVTYAAMYRAAVDMLRSGAPQADLLLIGPPDGVVRRHTAGPGGCGGAWQEPQNLAPVRAVQRRVAGDLGLAYWDWSSGMGGSCTMVAWAAANPPLAASDHVHLLHAGYRLTAEALFARLMGKYEIFLSHTQG
jgi:lysophospholipase L1-like esterase